MRRIAALVVFLLVAQLALSVGVSDSKLTELIMILERYSLITEKLSDSLINSETRIADLQTGFQAFEETVDLLLAKAKRQEREIVWLKVGIGVSLAACVVVWLVVK